jgi:hypothetical protein
VSHPRPPPIGLLHNLPRNPLPIDSVYLPWPLYPKRFGKATYESLRRMYVSACAHALCRGLDMNTHLSYPAVNVPEFGSEPRLGYHTGEVRYFNATVRFFMRDRLYLLGEAQTGGKKVRVRGCRRWDFG